MRRDVSTRPARNSTVFYNPAMPDPALKITPHLSIPESELVERFVRASGAGGQNINKVSTAVELRFDIARSPSLPEAVRARLLAKRDRRLTDGGVFVIDAQRFRTQDRNREDARERLAAFIASGLSVPKSRIATKPTRASKIRRLDGKRARSDIKRGRSGSHSWD
ncbi:aminoacyl-tRNA hydrolase [Ralstonia sp. SET104]|nr:aminoacyl-tRNA hydrolase [Ralstonia sp. SET104]